MQWRLFDPADPPEWITPEWYAGREAAPHLEQEGHRERLLLTADMVRQALSLTGDPFAGVCDFGAGDGGLLSLLPEHIDYSIGFDLQPSNVDAALVRGITVNWQDVVTNWQQPQVWLDAQGESGVLVACEFLEHLLDPHEFVRRLYASPARHLVASSPYTETPESHYEYHTWAFDLDGYRALLEDAGWRVIRQETAWISQCLLAVR